MAKTMDLILRQDVEHLGRRGDAVQVKGGYGRNYLLPRKLALPVTAGSRTQIERERAKFDAREFEETKVAQAVAAKLEHLEIEIARKVGETEALYGSVTTADIATALAARGFEIDRRKIQLGDPIKRLGTLEVPVKLHREVVARITVKVVAEGAPRR